MGSSHRKFLASAASPQIAVCIFPEPPPQVDEFTNGLGGHTWLNPSRAQCGFRNLYIPEQMHWLAKSERMAQNVGIKKIARCNAQRAISVMGGNCNCDQ